MYVTEIKNKSEWENFLSSCNQKTFLQSWNWGEFQKKMGRKIWRLGVFNPRLQGVALVIKFKAKRGDFLLIPHGPVAPKPSKLVVDALIGRAKKIAKKENIWFIRVAPIWDKKQEDIFEGWRAPMHAHPEVSQEIDITESENRILKKMRKNTRNLIRKALKNEDLKVETSKNIKDVESFNELYKSTVSRHKFVPYSLRYLKNEFTAFAGDDRILIFYVSYKSELLASAIVIFWGRGAFYHQGASTRKYKKLPSSYLLQWEVIKEAKRRGCNYYNLWGITESSNRNHPFRGITIFKTGFGGEKKSYVPTRDIPTSPLYFFTRLFEFWRKKKRGF